MPAGDVVSYTYNIILLNSRYVHRRFDEDSSSSVYFKRKVKYYKDLQYRFLMRSNVFIEDRPEGAKLHKMNKFIDKAIAMKTKAVRELESVWKQLMTKKKKEVEDPFSKWDQSTDKVEIIVMWRMIEGKDQKMGMLNMDIDAPASVAREYCRRFMREELNARCGELFLMVAKGEGLPLMEESNKRTGQLAPQKFNAQSREIEHTLLLVENKDPNLEKRQIPMIKSEALKQAEAQMEEKRVKSLIVDEKQNKEIEMSDELKDELKKELVMAGMKEKKINTLFNRSGNLLPMIYNDATRRMESERRSTFKKIIDQALGIDTQGDHNFHIGEDMIKELEEAAKNTMTEEEKEEAAEKAAMLKRKEEQEEKQRRREEKKRQEELYALSDDDEGENGVDHGGEKKLKRKEEADKTQGEGIKKAEEEKDEIWKTEKEERGEGDVLKTMGDGEDGDESLQEGNEEKYQTPWAEYYDDAGNVYYYNAHSGTSQYEYPEEWSENYNQG